MTQIWILGSSIPYWAGQFARSTLGKDLELPAEVLWHARRGMQWHQLDLEIMKLLKHS